MLVKYWSAAAIPIRHFDQDLSMICDRKSEYWTSPDNYTNENINNMGIKLDDVRQAYRQLLKPSLSIIGRKRK